MGPVLTDELNENGFDDVIIMRRVLHLTKEGIDSIRRINKTEESVKNEIIMKYEQSFFHDIERVQRIMRTEKDDFNFTSQKHVSNFTTYEIPPGL